MRLRLFRTLAALAVLGVSLAVTLSPTAGSSQGSGAPAELSSPAEIEAAFLRGMRLMNSGEPRKAVVLFRAILARDPDLPRVRLELARAYFLMESWSESREEFVTVLSDDIPSAVRKNILRFIRTIDARRGFDWDAAIGISLSPEAGRDYKTDTVRLDFFGIELPFKVDRDRKDVIGLQFSGSAEIRKGLFDGPAGPSVIGFLEVGANLFEAEGTDYDDYILSAGAGSRFVWPRTTAVAAVNASVRHKSGEVREVRKGLRGNLEHRFESGFSPSLFVSYSDVNVHDAKAQDGDLYAVGAGFTKPVLGFASIGAFASLEHLDARESFESYTGVGLSIAARADVGLGMGAMARAKVEHRDYQERIPLFPEIRDDLELSVDLELIKNDVFLLDHFSPFVRLGFTHNRSSIDIFTYNEYRFLVGVKNAF